MCNMEKNLKIRMRLLIVFLITILIALALTFLSIRQTIKIQRDYTSILSGPIAITYAVQSSETEVNSIARQLRDMALSGYDTSIMDEIQASVDSIEKSISTIQTLYTDSDGVAQTYIQSIHEWENAFEDIHTALQADNLEEARRLIETQCTPKLKYRTDLLKRIILHPVLLRPSDSCQNRSHLESRRCACRNPWSDPS